mmetsp:Transcript_4655/g.14754  ORF Transcript_4655/g.14754 Transcript_4655/m.14754 type:complete len:540 (-) Transcript_4655:1473-3092(-)
MSTRESGSGSASLAAWEGTGDPHRRDELAAPSQDNVEHPDRASGAPSFRSSSIDGPVDLVVDVSPYGYGDGVSEAGSSDRASDNGDFSERHDATSPRPRSPTPPSRDEPTSGSASPNRVKLTLANTALRDRLSSFGLDIESDHINTSKTTKQRFVNRQKHMLVLEFREDGTHDFLELRRDDILTEARSAVPLLNTETDSRYKAERQSLRKLRKRLPSALARTMARSDSELAERVRFKGTLQHRDVRLLDSTFVHSRDPAILVRRHAILVNLWPIKALVLSSRTLIFVPDGADSVLATLMTQLRKTTDERNPDYKEQHVPFVMRSLEAIFVTTCSSLSSEVDALVPQVHQTVKAIVVKSSGVTIERLRQIKSSVSKVAAKLEAVQSAFEDLLTSDREMALMRLDKIFAFPEFYDERNAEAWVPDHEEIELLLENYAQSIDGTLSRVDALGKEIDSAMSTIALRLDTARNKLLGVDLLVSSVTSAAAIGALFAGLFGMNLDSGVAEDPYWFWVWFGIIIGGVPVAVCIMFYAIYRQGLLIT